LPVLTCAGESFAARVGASLLRATGVPELITQDRTEYESLALELAGNPERLLAIRHKLADNRLIAPLFDARRFTNHIEAAYQAMVERHQAALKPQSLDIADGA
jgi:protein O-GlcNAc transferase